MVGQGTPERAERVRDELLRGLAYEAAVEPDAPASGPPLSPSGYDPESTPPLWPLKPRSLTVGKPQAVDDDDTPPSTPLHSLKRKESVRSTKSAVVPPWPRFARPEIEDVTTAERNVGSILPSAPRGGMAQSGFRRKDEPTPAPQGKPSPLSTALVAGAFVTGAGLAVFICVLLHVF